jgi:hypothetical protein
VAPPASSVGGPVTQFSLTSSAATGTQPFSMGIGFKKGDVPASFATSLDNYQVTVKRTWNDGSVKHAIIAGRAPLVQNVARTVTVTRGTAPGGTALTSADITAAAPSASVQCGALGTVNLSSLLATPFRTWVSGPEMVECHYRADVGGGTLLSVWFHVRLFADGRLWVRCIVENGFLDNGSGAVATITNQSYVPTLIVGGVTVYNNGGASLTHSAYARYMAEGWIGTNPSVTPLLDPAYLRATKLVPNYAFPTSAAALDALTQTYTPMNQGPFRTTFADTAPHAQICILPYWDAAYVATGDARAYRAVVAASSAHNRYAMCRRDKTTHLPAKPSSFANWTWEGPDGGGTDDLPNGVTWEVNHHASVGYLAYMLTGDYWHYETAQLQASCLYLILQTSRGSGANRVMEPSQERGIAWGLRSIAQVAAIAPDAELSSGLAADLRSMIAASYNAHQTRISANGSQIQFGSVHQPVYGNWGTAGSIPSYMTQFWVASNGYIADMEPIASMTTLNAVRDHMYKFPVGLLGPMNSINDHGFCRAGLYGLEASTGGDGGWRATWGDIYTATHGTPNNAAGNTLLGGNFPDADGYWPNLLPAISYAVEHGASGALTAYNRMVGATNWTTLTAGFAATPGWAILPRSGRVLQVGPGKAFTTMSSAFAVAREGDTIEVDAGDYTGTAATGTINTPNLYIKGVGGKANMRAAGQHAQSKGTWVVSGNNVRVENVDFFDAAVPAPDNNGAGIRIEAPNLTLYRCGFFDGQNGIQGGAGSGVIYLIECEFARNGFGDGFTHNVYVDVHDAVIAVGCFFHEAAIGHNFKSRARFNWLENCYFMDGPTGTASYLADFPNGGLVFLRGNCFHKGPNADNSISVAYAQESLASGSTHRLTMIHNTLVSTRVGGTFVAAPSGTEAITWTANIFAGNGTGQITGGFALGSVTQANNVVDTHTNVPGADSIASPSFWPNATLQALIDTGGVPDANYLVDTPAPYTLRAITANPRLAGALQASP